MLSVKQILNVLNRPGGSYNDPAFQIQVQRRHRQLTYRNTQLSSAQISALTAYWSDLLNIEIRVEAVLLILQIKPEGRIALVDGDIEDTDVRDVLDSVLSEFVLGCSWPIGLDGLSEAEFDDFMKLLRHQYAAIFRT
jgi:hypothetical protein